MAPNAQTAEPIKVPFRLRTRQRRYPIQNAISFVAGKSITVEVPQNGWISALYVRLTGTLANGSNQTLVPTWQYPFNLIKRFKYDANLGNAEIYNCSGFGAHLVSSDLEEGFRTDRAGAGDTVPQTDLYAAGVANGNNTWTIVWKIPISINGKQNFESGMINLQNLATRTKLVIECGSIDDIIRTTDGDPTSATFTGTIDVDYEYFEHPVPFQGEVIQRPMMSIVRTIETELGITQTGNVSHRIENQGFLLQATQRYITNGAAMPAGKLSKVSLVGNLTTQIDVFSPYVLKLEQRMRSGVNYPAEVFHIDYYNATGDLSSGDSRDIINTERYTTLQLVGEIASGTTLGVGNNFVHTIERRYVELEKR